MTDLSAAMEACKPELAERYAAHVRHLLSRMVADLGPDLRGVPNSWEWAKIYNGTVRQYLTRTRTIDEARLEAGATAYADAVVETWRAKIAAKLGELENADARRIDSVSFRITGEKNGRRVVIDQQMILNTSKLGTPFNQFPATLYLDGKRISEAAFKKQTKAN